MPGTQILHYIKQYQGEGGQNRFVDGFAVAEKMRKEFPEEWSCLATVPVQFADRGVTDVGDNIGVERFYMKLAVPTFVMDNNSGELVTVR